MYRLIRQKIVNKKWLTVCLMLGISLLIGILSCQPMFKEGALNKLINKKFQQSIEENNIFPTALLRNGSFNIGKENIVDTGVKKASKHRNDWMKNLDFLNLENSQTIMKLKESKSVGEYSRTRPYLSISYMTDMEEHIEIVKGERILDYKESEKIFPFYISQKLMDDLKFVVGEKVIFEELVDENGDELTLVVAGIIKESDRSDSYWYKPINNFEKEIFVDKDAFDKIARNFKFESVLYSQYELLDYNGIKDNNIITIDEYMKQYKKDDDKFSYSFETIINEYKSDKTTINIIIWVLELPILGMVLAFIYMVSDQITKLEKNEIAMLRSRGMSRRQILFIYIMQSSVLALFCMFIGIPLGYGLCKLAAGTTNFLTFSMNDLSLYTFTFDMIIYGLIAGIIGVVFVVLPVVPVTKISITEHKTSLIENKKIIWKKYFLDIILLVISVYLIVNFNKNIESIRSKAITGDKMDPMIFLDSILFIIALGLVVLRLIHYGVTLVYCLGKKKWNPVMYASFLQITRTFSKQGFISVFLILTIAMGIFNTNTARTINDNNEDRIEYNLGADIVIDETWEMNQLIDKERMLQYNYVEPDYERYVALEKDKAMKVARVIKDTNTQVTKGNKSITNCTIMGINTKEFGEVANYKDELNKNKHWYESLNSLAKVSNGVVISSNLAKDLEVSIGDKITCYRYKPIVAISDEISGELELVVQDIVDAWPGYNQYIYAEDKTETKQNDNSYSYQTGDDNIATFDNDNDSKKEESDLKENYLLVCNYASVVGAFEISPYEIWVKQNDSVSAYDIYEELKNKGIKIENYSSKEYQITDMKESPMIQITNGLFTLSFIIALLLCGVGFLIYWITSIKQRELLFGVYRAMGLSVKNINKMLINEHIFSTFLAVIAGAIVGITTTKLFVRLFGIIYLPQKHNLDIYVYYEIFDMLKLISIILVIIIVCILILRTIVKKMNITQALKLGEE